MEYLPIKIGYVQPKVACRKSTSSYRITAIDCCHTVTMYIAIPFL